MDLTRKGYKKNMGFKYMKKIKIILVGAGPRGINWLKVIKKSNYVELIGICDLNIRTKQKIKALHLNKIPFYTNFKKAVIEGQPDAALLSTSPFNRMRDIKICCKYKIAALVGVISSVDAKPTAQSYDVLDDLVTQAKVHYKKLDKVLTVDLFKFNNMVSDAAVPAVMIVPSEMSKSVRTMPGHCNLSVRLNNSGMVLNASSELKGATTILSKSPWLAPSACHKSPCSVLVGTPVDGPAR